MVCLLFFYAAYVNGEQVKNAEHGVWDKKVTAESLASTHALAMWQYDRKDVKSVYSRRRNAIKALESANIQSALKNKPKGMSDKILAMILNDYGYFLSETYDREKEAIGVLEVVIKLNPNRSVAYLNLGDTLRKQLRRSATFDEKKKITEDIKVNYLKYRKLAKRTTQSVDDFLTLNIIDKPISNICEYIATYTNSGRLWEILGVGRGVLKLDGKGTMDVRIPYQGTAHMPSLEFIDTQSGEKLANSQENSMRNMEDDSIRWANDIDVIPFSDGHHVLFQEGDGYLTASTPIGATQKNSHTCRFKAHTVEELSKNALDPDLCTLVQSSQHELETHVAEAHTLSYQALRKLGLRDTTAEKTFLLDFDNDGSFEPIIHLSYSSGAGPGCGYDYYEMLNPAGDGFSATNERKLLAEMQKPRRCKGNKTGWFKYKDVTYFENKYPYEQPMNSFQQFHTVSYISDGKVSNVCQADFKLQVEYLY